MRLKMNSLLADLSGVAYRDPDWDWEEELSLEPSDFRNKASIRVMSPI